MKIDEQIEEVLHNLRVEELDLYVKIFLMDDQHLAGLKHVNSMLLVTANLIGRSQSSLVVKKKPILLWTNNNNQQVC